MPLIPMVPFPPPSPDPFLTIDGVLYVSVKLLVPVFTTMAIVALWMGSWRLLLAKFRQYRATRATRATRRHHRRSLVENSDAVKHGVGTKTTVAL